MKRLTKLLITIISVAGFSSPQIHAVAGMGEHYAKFGDKQHCKELETDIKAKEKKQNKSKQELENLAKLKFNFTKEDCTEKLKK